MKFFNTAGPVNQEKHYKLDPLTRWDMEEIFSLIGQEKYFILHAPRQTGKTSCLLALEAYLNKRGDFYCVYANFETAQVARNDLPKGLQTILEELDQRCKLILKKNYSIKISNYNSLISNNTINLFLSDLSASLKKPFILLIDEIDSLVGDTLISILRQIRSGYDKRPSHFPQTILLCGVRDIKDYRIQTTGEDIITGGSAFNIKAASLTLGNFSECEVRKLYTQHTKETGQIFEETCFPLIMEYTDGQPWLVNALAYEVTHNMKENRDRTIVIKADHFKLAKENLILSRVTHLDQLADKLKEDRVRRVIEPMFTGNPSNALDDDKSYCEDLGLIKKSDQGFVVSNEIYKEVIPRELTNAVQDNFLALYKIPKWVNEDQSINIEKLMNIFVQFWRENSDSWKRNLSGYLEAAPHLIFQGFLQRVANGHGTIHREYALGNKRVDLYLQWKTPTCEQRTIFELKIRSEKHNTKESFEKMKQDAVTQTLEYADKCNPQSSNIIIFDRRNNIPWSEKIFTEEISTNNYKIKIWGV